MSTVEAPKIVITQPSPMPPPKEGRVMKEEAALADAMPTIPATKEVAVSGEFKPSTGDCRSCGGAGSSNEPQVARVEELQEARVEEPPEPQEARAEEPQEARAEGGSLQDIPSYTPTGWCFQHYCGVWTRNWKLKCLIFFDFILLPVFVSAVYMGAANIGKCRLNDSIPIILFVMGVTGFSTAAYSLVKTVRKLKGASSQSNQDSLVLPGAVMTTMLLVTETMIVLLLNASYDPSDKKYCDKTFHTYVTYFVWCGSALLLKVLVYLGVKKLVKDIRNARTTQESGNEQ